MSASDDAFYTRVLDWRGIETPCERCQGAGSYMYGSTAMWMGGIGGAACTVGVCDKCWGSGDANRKWTDLRRMQAGIDQRVSERAASLLADRFGFVTKLFPEDAPTLIAELERIGRKRSATYGMKQLTKAVARVLSELSAATKAVTR